MNFMGLNFPYFFMKYFQNFNDNWKGVLLKLNLDIEK